MGSIAAFVASALCFVSLILIGGYGGMPGQSSFVMIGFTLLQLVTFFITGVRMRTGKDAFSGIASAAFMALKIVGNLLNYRFAAVMIVVVLLICVMNGIRGALTLRGRFPEDDRGVFS